MPAFLAPILFSRITLERDRDLNPGPQGYEDFLRK